MANGIIDLRKQSPAYSQDSRPHDDITARSNDVPEKPRIPLLPEAAGGFDLEWAAYEHENRIRGPYWFLYPLVIATACIVYGIFIRNYLFVVFVAVSFALLSYYAKKPPRMLRYRIEKRGIWINDKLMDFTKFQSFWIFTHPLMAPELLLETHSPINPIMYIRLEHIAPDGVRNIIKRYLPEKEQKDSMSSQIARILGF